MSKIKVWLNAARLRTLPLSVAGIIVGNALGSFYGTKGGFSIFMVTLCTAVGFQVISNFANDYGDGVKGTDNAERIGPKRMLQSGLLTRGELRNGIMVSSGITVILVLVLIYIAFGKEWIGYSILFLVLGTICIWAAIKYTIGTSAYGYIGLGDFFVFIFFGLLAVMGSMFLHTKFLNAEAILPACTIGFLSTGVLNLNNLRDCETDKKAGKKTMIVRMGFGKGKTYHFVLLIAAFVTLMGFVLLNFEQWYHFICFVAFIPIFIHMRKVSTITSPVLLDGELKKLALSTFALAVLFYISFNNFCNFEI